jgi:hypothetical protein
VIPTIAVGFVLLAGLLLWFVIGSRGRWWVKLPAIVVTCAFTFAVWNALGSFSGWPTDQSPPARALLLSSAVDEPKAIYVWLMAPTEPGLLAYRPTKAEPRAYRLPYSRELHQQIDRASALAKQGQPVELRRTNARDSRSHIRAGHKARYAVRAYRLPPQSLLRKNSTAEAPGP